MDLEIVSLTVEDMDRALEFYTKFLGQDPAREDERFSWFDLGNARLGLYNPSEDGETVAFGENCVPAFRVEDIEAVHERLLKLAPEVEDIQEPDGYHLFHFTDTEGNMVEIYSGKK